MKLHQTEAGATIDLEEGVQFDRKYGLLPILDMGTSYPPTGGQPVKEGAAET